LNLEGAVNVIKNPVILETNLNGVTRHARGKVRDVYSVDQRLLIVATDRISAFDYILATGIPDKGRVLTQLSIFWFDFLRDVTPTHFLTAQVDQYPDPLPRYRDQLDGRSMLVKRADMIEIECVARGYISGSGWKDYRKTGAICGIPLPQGLRESDALPEPIYTPATKAQSGHDENISFEASCEIVGQEMGARLRDLTLQIYTMAANYARPRGIILADTKFEFGERDDSIIVIDEMMTPDSSRYWPLDAYRVGTSPPSFDKQFVRDWLETTGWDKNSPPPRLPDEVVAKTRLKYIEAYEKLSGAKFAWT
jgi:phosphoribosylaminoimidazole-succinocarboxamide synthase